MYYDLSGRQTGEEGGGDLPAREPRRVKVLALPGVVPRAGRPFEFDHGTTIAEMVATAFPKASEDHLAILRVTIGGKVVPQGLWAIAKPKAGTQVIIRPVPSGNNLGSVLMIVVAIAAIATGQFYAAPLALSLGISTAAAQGIITGAITLVGTLLINAFIQPKQPKPDRERFKVEGWQNQFDPGGAIPLVFGEVRYAPPFAAKPWTEQIGDDTYCTAVFNFGYGPLRINQADLFIGDNPMYDGATPKFIGLEVEIREGYATDGPITLYPEYVWQEALNKDLIYEQEFDNQPFNLPRPKPIEVFTAADASKISVDISFPSGLVHYSKSGDLDNNPVNFLIEYRLDGAGPYTAWPGGAAPFTTPYGAVISNTYNISDKIMRSFTRTISLDLPARGRYQIRITRYSLEIVFSSEGARNPSRMVWSAMRSFRPEYPLNFDKPLALVAVRVKANKQLNGVLDNMNAKVARRAKHWNGSAWIDDQVTSNPADLIRWFRQGPSVRYPRLDSEIHLSHPILGLEPFAEGCTTNSLKFDHVYDQPIAILEVLKDIARGGRASPFDDGYRLGVTVDKPRDFITAYVTAANSWGFSGEFSFPRLPDALRVPFLDETNKFVPAERIVPRPGFVGTPEILLEHPQVGNTNPDSIWTETRRYWYEILHRRDTWVASQDFESLGIQRGDRVVLNHDMLARAQASGRVLAVAGDGLSVTVMPPVIMEAGKVYSIQFRRVAATQAEGEPLYDSLIRGVVTAAGETSVLQFSDAGDLPAADDLFLFGETASLSFDAIVKNIERGANLTARITMTNHAPEIDTLLAADPPPVWDGRIGEIIFHDEVQPEIPVVRSVATDPATIDVLVRLRPGDGSARVATYEVRHRLVGAGSWTTDTGTGPSGMVVCTGAPYVIGNNVEYQARALPPGGTPVGLYTTLATFVVGSDLPSIGAPVIDDTLVTGTYQASLPWTNPNDFITAATVWRGGPADNWGDVGVTILADNLIAVANQHMVHNDQTAGSFRYWVTVKDDRGNVSLPDGPADFTTYDVVGAGGKNILGSDTDMIGAA